MIRQQLFSSPGRIQPLAFIRSIRYAAINEPIWFPVISSYSPAELRRATPIRSASGSVATTKSAFSFFACSIPSASASPFSGLGDFTVGNLPSPFSCEGTMEADTPADFNIAGTIRIPVPCSGEKTTFSFAPSFFSNSSSITSSFRASR